MNKLHVHNILVMIAFFAWCLLVSFAASANTNDCQRKAEQAKIIKQQYDKGTKMSTIAIEFPPRSEMRNLVFKVYRGEADNVSPEQLSQSTYDICRSNKK